MQVFNRRLPRTPELLARAARLALAPARRPKISAPSLLLALLAALVSPPAAQAAVSGSTPVAIGNYSLVSSTRLSRTLYEYTYTADASNWGTDDAAISATLASTASNVTVVQGALDFGSVPVGATQTSSGTFVIRVDRTQSFDESSLLWTVTANALPPSTYELIDAAVAAGTIDAETGLLYKVYYEFGDSRLPAQYLGRNDGRNESSGAVEAKSTYSTLSAQTQALVLPFLAPPTDPQSWYQQRLALVSGQAAGASAARSQTRLAGRRAGARTAAVAAVATAPSACSGPDPFNLTDAILTQNGKVCVHYWLSNTYGSAAGLSDLELGVEAQAMANEIDATIWPKLTGLFGNPPVGADGLLHIYVQSATSFYLEANTLGLTIESSEGPSCGPQTVPSIYIQHGLPNWPGVLAHEITHAILDRTLTADGCTGSNYFWLHEATATWAMHYVYPPKNTGGEQDYARRFLNFPELPLETFNNLHQYGAYLLDLYMTQGDSTSTPNTNTNKVPQVWEAYTSLDALQAIDSVIGGLDQKWPEFALYNWNRQQQGCGGAPYAYYAKWDCLNTMVRESTGASPTVVDLKGAVAGVYPLPHLIKHLSAKYWHFDLTQDSTIRRVRLVQPYSQNNPSGFVKVQAIVKLHSGGWQSAVDWTGFAQKTLCRDKAQENVDELVIVISHSNFEDPSAQVSDTGANGAIATKLQVSALGCSNWSGTANLAYQHSGFENVVETAAATNVTWTFDYEDWTDTQDTQDFKLTAGSVKWTHTGNIPSLGCSGTSSGTFPATGAGTSSSLNLGLKVSPLYDASGDAAATSFGGPVTEPDPYTCTGPVGSFQPVTQGLYADWLETSDGTHFPVIYRSSGGTPGALDDSYTQTVPANGDTYTWTWTFKKNGFFAYQ